MTKIQLTVWGTRQFIEAIASNYLDPRILHDNSFKDAFSQLLPQPVVAVNHHIGAVCSVMPLVTNFFLVEDEYLIDKQPIMPIPDGYGFDINLVNRASESFNMEVLPDFSVSSYNDFVIDLELSVPAYLTSDLPSHFSKVLECVSAEHCFAWFILATDDRNVFRQISNIRRTDVLTIPDGHNVEPGRSDIEIFSFSEKVMNSPDDDGDFFPLKTIIENHGPETYPDDIQIRHYWPAKATPGIFSSTVKSFFIALNRFESFVEFEDTPNYSYVLGSSQ